MTSEQTNNSMGSPLSPQQRARIEENRRRAEERLRQKAAIAAIANTANSNGNSRGSTGSQRRAPSTPNKGGTPAKQTTLFSFFKTPPPANNTRNNAENSDITPTASNVVDTLDSPDIQQRNLLAGDSFSPLSRFNNNSTTKSPFSSQSLPPPPRPALFKNQQQQQKSSDNDDSAAISLVLPVERDVIPSSLTRFHSMDDDTIDATPAKQQKLETEPISNLRKKKRVRYIASDDDDDDEDSRNTSTLKRSTKSKLNDDDDDDDDDEYKDEPINENIVDDMELDDEIENLSPPPKSSSSSRSSKTITVKATKSKSSTPTSSLSDRLKMFSSSSDTKRGDDFGSSPSSSLGNSQPIQDKERSRHPDRYPWLVNVRDADGNSQDDPDYNPRTLYIPESAKKKFTPFEKQFWDIKQQFYDTVVFFKKGKFYVIELYENDADIGHSKFDLKMTDRVNMRMVGVPESSFDFWVGKFIAKGYKVAKVDQMETALGKALREKANKVVKEDKIIKRELTSVLTGGTLVDAGLLTNEMATFCLSIKVTMEQVREQSQNGPCIGVAFVDTSCAEFSLCYFEDELDRNRLETLLAQIQPKEIIYEKGHLSKETMRLLKNTLHGTIWNALVSGREYWDADQTVFEINGGDYFKGSIDTEWPLALKQARHQPLLMSAFGVNIINIYVYVYIRLDKELVSLKNFHTYDPIRQSTSLMIDGQTLKNLEIFENTFDGGQNGTLFQLLNKCITPFGKRMFKRWMCHPLQSVKAIEARLDTIDELNRDGSCQITNYLERMVSRVHAGTCRLKELFSLLDAFGRLEHLMLKLKGIAAESLSPMPRLKELCNRFPSLEPPLTYFKTAFDREIAEREGSVIPYEGVEKDYDEIGNKMKLIQQELQDYLIQQRTEFKSKDIVYKDIGKERYQLEVPKKITVPSNYMRLSQTKAVNRYWSPKLKKLVTEYEETMELHIQKRVYNKFDEYYELWMQAVRIAAELDSLLGMALGATTLGEPCCRPEFVNSSTAVFKVEELRHPCVIPGIATDFIPNDTELGGGNEPNMILLTGPNMGGKSTLLRQTCIAIIMAQMGCYVPARQCRLTPVDRIFTRIGANDNIMAGQSTFMVELIILDELGRGTSTFDGYAIAYSVLHYLATMVGCLGLFSTHYGLLTEEMAHHANIALKHMACYVDDDRKKVTFLYKLTNGACPKSYGMHVANMAGVPTTIVHRAEEVAKTFEQQSRGHQLVMQKGQVVTVADHADIAYLTRLLNRCSINKCNDTNHPHDDPDRMLTSSPGRGGMDDTDDITMMDSDDHDTSSKLSMAEIAAIKRIWRTWKTKHTAI
ncbi:muts domain V-domain-containing protein [Syncephalis fuscata]|nr:muts domain V-domain-containing protein [Syncephalis fuscata]